MRTAVLVLGLGLSASTEMSGATSSEPGRIALQLNVAVPSPARLGGMALGFGRLKGRVPTGSRWRPGAGLRGTPGQVHTLVFDRKGQRFIVTARVERFM